MKEQEGTEAHSDVKGVNGEKVPNSMEHGKTAGGEPEEE